MGPVIGEIVAGFGPPPDEVAVPEPWEPDDPMSDVTTDELGAPPAGFGCPSCHGALFEIQDRPAPRFRCRIGHAWTAQTLLDEQSDALEGALWMALRSLEEKAALSHRLAISAQERGSDVRAVRYAEIASETHEASRTIRGLIVRMTELNDGTRSGDFA